jgi:hypothetical protein
MKKPLIFKLACTALLLLLTVPGPITADETPKLSETWAMTVKSGHEADFEAAFKAHGAVRAGEHQDPQEWDMFSPVTGSDFRTYVLRSCCFDWADLDANEAWSNENPEVMQDWFANVHPHVESYAHFFWELDTANSHWGKSGEAFKFIGVTGWDLIPGHADDFTKAKEKISQIAINNGWATEDRAWGWSTRIGGKSHVSLAVPYSSYADMAPGEESFFEFLTKHMGAEGAAELMEQFTSSVHKSSYTIWRHRPDLASSSE